MTCPTTRRHPRSLSEAFPDVRACAVERYHAPRWHRPAGVLLAAAIGVAGAFSLYAWSVQ